MSARAKFSGASSKAYLRNGEPLGSRNLSRMLPMSLSPASVRNVMSDLEDLGLDLLAAYQRRPPADAERACASSSMPSCRSATCPTDERASIDAQVGTGQRRQPMEHMLTEASQMLSGMSRGAGLVITAKNEVPLKHVEFIRLEPTKALAVLVSQNDEVENRIIELPAGVTTVAAARKPSISSMPISGADAGRGASSRSRGSRTRPARRSTRCPRIWSSGALPSGRAARRPADAADRARTRQSARERHRPGRHASACASVRRSRKEGQPDRAPRSGRKRAGRAHLHRLGKQAVLAVRLVADRRALPRQGCTRSSARSASSARPG